LPAYSKAQTINCVNSVLPKKVSNLKTHINTSTFSASSAHSVNNVFSADYKNYRLVVDLTASGNVEMLIRFRVGGADETGANYNHQALRAVSTTLSGSASTGGTSGVISVNATNRHFFTIDIANVFLTQNTDFISTFYNVSQAVGLVGNLHALANSYTGFTIFPQANNITGSVSVFGYED
jgi:hypothetical protein